MVPPPSFPEFCYLADALINFFQVTKPAKKNILRESDYFCAHIAHDLTEQISTVREGQRKWQGCADTGHGVPNPLLAACAIASLQPSQETSPLLLCCWLACMTVIHNPSLGGLSRLISSQNKACLSQKVS